MATLGELVRDLKARLDERGSSRAFENDDLRRWVYEGARDVARRAEVLQDTATVAVTSGTNEYTVPTDLVRLYRVVWVPSGGDQQYPLEYLDFNSMDSAGWTWTSAEGYPVVFTLWGYPPNLKVVLYPTPTENGSLNLWYYRFPTALDDDGSDDLETVDVPAGWEDIVVLYAEAIALRKDGDQRWAEAKQMYEAQLNEMVDRTRRWTDQAGGIQVAGRWLPSWLYGGDDW